MSQKGFLSDKQVRERRKGAANDLVRKGKLRADSKEFADLVAGDGFAKELAINAMTSQKTSPGTFWISILAAVGGVGTMLFCVFFWQALRDGGSASPATYSFSAYRDFAARDGNASAWTRDVPKPATLPACRRYESNVASVNHQHCVLRNASVHAVNPAYFDTSVPPCESVYAYACGGWKSPADVVFDGLDVENYNTVNMLTSALAGQFDVDDLFRPPEPRDGSFRDSLRDYSTLMTMCEMRGDPELRVTPPWSAAADPGAGFWHWALPAPVLEKLRSDATEDRAEALGYIIGKTAHDGFLSLGIHDDPRDRGSLIVTVTAGATLGDASSFRSEMKNLIEYECGVIGWADCDAVSAAYGVLISAAKKDLESSMSSLNPEADISISPMHIFSRSMFDRVVGGEAISAALLGGWGRGVAAAGWHIHLEEGRDVEATGEALASMQRIWVPGSKTLHAMFTDSNAFIQSPHFAEVVLTMLSLDAGALSAYVERAPLRHSGGSFGLAPAELDNQPPAPIVSYAREREQARGEEQARDMPADGGCRHAVGGYFDNVLNEVFFGWEVDAGTHSVASDIVNGTTEAIIEMIAGSRRYSQGGKDAIEEKLRAITVFLGLPWPDGAAPHPPTSVTEGADTLAEGLMRVRARNAALEVLGQAAFPERRSSLRPGNQRTFLMEGWRANAFYVPWTNAIQILPGALVPPLFYPAFGPAALFGRLGFIVAHEKFHAFDVHGERYDAEGNLRSNWMPLGDRSQLSDFHRCVADDYTRETRLGNRADGDWTNGEDTADVCGLQAAARAAYRASGDQLTAEDARTLALSFAQTWCADLTRNEEHGRMANVHSPPQPRVDGALRHAVLPNGEHLLSAAFNCPAPADVCQCIA